MDIQIISQLIGSMGFPIVCCWYLMTTMDKTIKTNTDATNNLAALVQRLLDKSGGDVN